MGRIIVEQMSHVDVNDLHSRGAFDGVPRLLHYAGLRTTRYMAEFTGARWPVGRPPQLIPIQWTPCHFGGARPWFTCLCGRRVGKLYYGGGFQFLGCRPCGEMIYESQRKGRRGRVRLRASRIRGLLADDGRPGIDPLPPRYPGTHRKTYARRLAQAEALERKLAEGRPYRPRPRWRRRYR